MMRKSTICVALLSARVLAQGLPFEAPRAVKGELFFPSVVAAVDVDLDGHRDLIIANGIAIDARGPFETVVLDADWKVRARVTAPATGEVGLNAHPAMVSGTLGSDSLEDVVVLSDSGSIAAYENPGPGRAPLYAPAFGKPRTLARLHTMIGQTNPLARCRYHRVEAVDIDGDGAIEVVQSHTVWTLFETLGQSGLTFFHDLDVPARVGEGLLMHGVVRDFVSGDFDGDGDVDFVALVGDNDVAQVWQRSNKFEHTSAAALQPTSPRRIARIDVDSDGRDEYLLSAEHGAVFWLHSYEPTSRVIGRHRHDLDDVAVLRVEQMIAIDHDADGDEDLVVQALETGNGSSLFCFENQHGVLVRIPGKITTPWEVGMSEYPVHATRPAVCDVDQDGRLDIVFGGMRDRATGNIPCWIVRGTHASRREVTRLVRGSKPARGDIATLSFANSARLGHPRFGIRLARVEAGRHAALLHAWRPLLYELAGNTVVAGLWNCVVRKTQGQAESGWSEVLFDVPDDRTLLDFKFRFQWLYEDASTPGGFGTSDGWALQVRR